MHPLAEKIRRLQRRLIWRRRLVAASAVAAAILAAVIALGLADYALRYSDRGLRLMASALLVGIAGWAAYRWWFLPRRQPMALLNVARRIDAQFPSLRDSLSSAVEFLEDSETDPTAGSPSLRRLVIAEADQKTQSLPIEEILDRRPLRRAAAWLAVIAVIGAVLVAMDPRAAVTAMTRLAMPLGETEWPRRHHLEFRDPPTRLAAGETFEVELIDRSGNLPEDVRIEYRALENGRRMTSREPMIPAGDVMVARRENVRRPFAFRAVGGDHHTMRWHEVEVVEPPRLSSLSLVVHPPAYSGLATTTSDRHLEVLAGSGIEASGTASEPLGGARILLDGGKTIPATFATADASQPSRRFVVPAEKWTAAESGSYRVELEDAGGVSGIVGPWNLRVLDDPPPTVTWQRPTEDLYVTTQATVPIELVVSDNLTIHHVELVYERLDQPAAGESRTELYRAPSANPTPEARSQPPTIDEARIVEHAWDLDALRLPSGAQLRVHAEASDFRPGTGRTVSDRRITIITAAELEARLADRLANIVRQLQRALAAQRTTRDEVRRLEIQQRDVGTLGEGDLNALHAAELAQRRLNTTLVDKTEGISALAAAVVAELDMSRIQSPNIRQLMAELISALERLAAGPVPTAERELTAARKSADASHPERLTDALAAAGRAQDEIIAELERLLDELSSWADYGRFARELAELRDEQLAHAKSTREEIGTKTLPLEPSELTRTQRATLNKAAAGEAALADRFQKIDSGMAKLAEELVADDPAAAAVLRDAVQLAAELTIARDMQAAAEHLTQNRVGRALALEDQLADDLQQVLDVLRDRGERDDEKAIDKLAKAEERLAELREQLAALREQQAKLELQGAAASAGQRARLAQQQQHLKQQIAALSRELKQLEADAASQSTQQAADILDDHPTSQQPDADPLAQANEQRPRSEQARAAEQKLADAARQLQEHRAEAEQSLALQFIRRFQEHLDVMLERQRKVVHDTATLDRERSGSDRLTTDQSRRIHHLADNERDMAATAHEQSELLAGLAAIRLSLEETAAQLQSAAKRLDEGDTGPTTQHAEHEALQRLEGLSEAFAETAAEAQPNQPNGAGEPTAGEDPDQPARRPTFELLEVKVLRMLQADLHERTRQLEQRLAEVPPAAPERAELDRQARELAAQQGRLAELVEEMLSRDNEQ